MKQTSVAEQAATNFMNGYNCGQAVLAAFAPRFGLSEEQAMRIAAAFGGGMGRQRMTCGTVQALAVLSGLAYGNTTPTDKARMARSFDCIKDLTEQFKAQWGSAVCGEILGLKGFCKAEGPAHQQVVPDEYRGKPCALKVRLAAQLFEQSLRQEAASK